MAHLSRTLQSSSPRRPRLLGYLNGSAVTLTTNENWYSTDTQGTLNFIIPTESLASQVLTISGLRDFKGVDINVPLAIFDPTKGTMNKMGSNLNSFQDSGDLKRAKTHKEEPLCTQRKPVCLM